MEDFKFIENSLLLFVFALGFFGGRMFMRIGKFNEEKIEKEEKDKYSLD